MASTTASRPRWSSAAGHVGVGVAVAASSSAGPVAGAGTGGAVPRRSRGPRSPGPRHGPDPTAGRRRASCRPPAPLPGPHGAVHLDMTVFARMTEITVRALDEDDWAEYRAVRLAALRSRRRRSWRRYEEESALDEEVWRERMRRSRRLVAERGGHAPSASSASAAPGTRRTTPASSSASGCARPSGAPASPGSSSRPAPTQAARRRPQPPRLLGRHRERPRRRLRQRLRLPPHRQPPADARVSEEDGEEEIAMVLPLARRPLLDARLRAFLTDLRRHRVRTADQRGVRAGRRAARSARSGR